MLTDVPADMARACMWCKKPTYHVLKICHLCRHRCDKPPSECTCIQCPDRDLVEKTA